MSAVLRVMYRLTQSWRTRSAELLILILFIFLFYLIFTQGTYNKVPHHTSNLKTHRSDVFVHQPGQESNKESIGERLANVMTDWKVKITTNIERNSQVSVLPEENSGAVGVLSNFIRNFNLHITENERRALQPESDNTNGGESDQHTDRKQASENADRYDELRLRDAQTKKYILVHTANSPDSWSSWCEAFPDHILVPIGQTTSQDRKILTERCQTIPPENIQQFLLQNDVMPIEIMLAPRVDDSTMACVQALIQQTSKYSRYKVFYNQKGVIRYNSTRHFGCGGVHLGESVSPYSFCENPDPQGLVVGMCGSSSGCSQVYPSMILDTGIHALSQLQCAWFPSSMLWSVPILAKPASASDLVLGMLVEKLLWSMGQHVEVMATQYSDSSIDILLSEAAGKAVAGTLAAVTCIKATFTECSSILTNELVAGGHLDNITTHRFQSWLMELEKVGYKLPLIKASPIKNCSNRSLLSFASGRDLGNSDAQVNLDKRQNLHIQTCPKSNERTHNFQEPWLQYRDILLIVTFNRNIHYDTIPYLETLYRQIFPHILYCGPGVPDRHNAALQGITFSFVSYDDSPPSEGRPTGALFYECLILASGLGYNVSGYLMNSDDTLLNPHRLRHYDVNKAWYWQLNNTVRVHTFDHNSCDDLGCKLDDRNDKFWHKFRNSTSGAILELNSTQAPEANLCNDNRRKLYGGRDWHIRIISGTVYVPARYIHDVTFLLKIFLRHKVYVEIVLPTVLHCTIPQKDIDPIYMSIHNLEKTIRAPYTHTESKPSNPDLVILSIIDRGVIRGPPPSKAIWRYVTQEYLRGALVFHAHKLGQVILGEEKPVQFFCDVLGFFGDVSGSAAEYFPSIDALPEYESENSDILPL